MTLPSLDLAAVPRLALHSLAVIRAGQDAGGAYLAAPTFPTYRFSWFRDGAFIADAMSRGFALKRRLSVKGIQ